MDAKNITTEAAEVKAKRPAPPDPPQLLRARAAVRDLGCVILIEAMVERWSAPGCRGVASELLIACREWLNGGSLDNPLIKAAYALVEERQEAEKRARLAEVGA